MKRTFSGLLVFVVAFTIQAQEVDRSTILLNKVVISETTILLQGITNKSSENVRISIDGKEDTVVGSGKSVSYGRECKFVSAAAVGGSENVRLWTKEDTAGEWRKMLKEKEEAKVSATSDDQTAGNVSEANSGKPTAKLDCNVARPVIPPLKNEKLDAFIIISSFRKNVESNSYYSDESIEKAKMEIDRHIQCLNNWADKNAYITEQHLNDYLKEEKQKLGQYRTGISTVAQDFIDYYKKYEIDDLDACSDSLQSILMEKLERREADLDRLDSAMNSTAATSFFFDINKLDKKILYNCGAILVLFLLLVIWFIRAKRKKRTRRSLSGHNASSVSGDSPAIVVRRKTTSILKKQSLEDVINNKAYMKIECSDFCHDSAVRRIYIKNTCVKDIYNMYAEDLRNPDNPKEDGCMVLGRWVYDDQGNEYYVSLEYIVLPGDDAVFQEYELNFGGKIKLKVAEKLRKLRRDTNLQYDLTCWVHSHPGLGVFFSNSDSNVQMQLKHPAHPNFLTAIVIDILTPQQEMGIFTFKRDSTINSKVDLKKMYSLEELYKWAVESDRYSYKAEDHYNSLLKAELHSVDCYGIELSNSAVIDMCSLTTTEPMNGLIGWAHGFPCMRGDKTEYVIVSVSKSESVPDNQLLGCFVVGNHCSIPSIRKAVSAYTNKVKFVLFYSTTDGTLTTIPISNNQLGVDEKYYGEEKLEDLKIWTRRKR
ncbi:hypothetical protein [Phocaeicola sp.]